MPLNPAVPAYGKTITGANEAIGCTTPTAATGVLTFSGQPANGETVTIGPFTYVWTNVTANVTGQTPYYVLIGTNTAGSITNLTAAINGTASKGTLFSNNTRPNPLATAVATSGTILTVTATNPGADGNGFATTETMANATWGAATTTGGVSASLQVTSVAPTVGGATVVGIQEVDNSSTVTSPTGATIAAGGLSWAFIPSSDFVGTLKLGTGSAVAWTGAMGSASRDAQPGNTLPGATITCSAGSYIILEGRPS